MRAAKYRKTFPFQQTRRLCSLRLRLMISSNSHLRALPLYERWAGAHESGELHLYAQGGHGFGMRKQNLPTDLWIDRFADWLELQGWLSR